MKIYAFIRLRGGGDADLWRRLHLSTSNNGLGMRGFYPWFLSMVGAEPIQPDLNIGTNGDVRSRGWVCGRRSADFAANSFVIGWSQVSMHATEGGGGLAWLGVAKGFSQGRCVDGG